MLVWVLLMIDPTTRILIFTDLDGTLLDHHSYSPAPADRYIRSLDQAGVGVIAVTSKTRAETEQLMGSIGSDALFSTENGSIIHAPRGFPWTASQEPQHHVMGVSYVAIQDQLANLPSVIRSRIRGFADMSAYDISQETGLSLADARKAKMREASEPFLWSGSEAELFDLGKAVEAAGLTIQRGGRFYHLTGGADKKLAMQWMRRQFLRHIPDLPIVTIALGDGPNDLKMIEAADHGVIIPNADGSAIASTRPSVFLADRPGPEGWVIAVRKILSGLGLQERAR